MQENTEMQTKPLQKKSGLDMTSGNPLKLIMRFAMPLLLGNIAQQLYLLADTIIVGRFSEYGDDCIAAVGVSSPIMFFMTALFFGIGQGATIIISQFFGANDKAAIKKAVDTIYIFLFIAALPLTIIGLLISRPILNVMNAQGQILEYASAYLSISFLGILPSFGFNINSGILQGIGNSKISLLFLGIASIVNIILDIIFVAVFKWGTAGVAVATVIAQSTSFIFGIYHINRRNYGFRISFNIKKLQFDSKFLKNIVRLGLPGGIQNVLFSIGFMFLHSLVNTINAVHPGFTTGFTSAQRVDSFAFLPIMSFSAAVTAFVGQNIGAGKLDRVISGVRMTCLLGIGSSIIICVTVLPLSRILINMFSQTEAVIQFGQGYLFRMMPFIWILAVHFIISNSLRGAGQTIVPLIGSFIGLWLARIPSAYLIYYLIPGVPENIYFSFVTGWILGLIPVGAYYLSGKWKKKAFRFVRGDESTESENITKKTKNLESV